MMYWLSIFRIAALAWACFCAIVLLGLGAHVLSSVGGLRLPTFGWAGLSVATAVLALLTMPPMLVIDFLRSGAFTSMIVVELSWIGFLGVLFLATGGAAAANASDFWVSCDTWTPALARTVCSETSAAAAFGFLGWIAVWTYTGTLLTMLIIQAQRGNYVWQQSVKEAKFQGGSAVPPVTTTAPGLYDTEAKPYGQAAAVHPAQVPYAYPPSTMVSPQTTGQPIAQV
ncbi:hypothetical protein L226DRAFT_565216 [Lentinus tigrinus ALCF2SS1-7]|uniref:uncharacterized protein n=1 Tax=Lentinus tigrinus ALCF2SS1-7 TaxID=1328758 RepID=UPI001165E931|nr:hypothetical protein L226DRAFT_565216 [Lentinus tigrinus ALCF2SS1-7]